MILKVIKWVIVGSLISLQVWAASIGDRGIQPNNWVPFPWAKELPITMTTTQGVWMVKSGQYSSYFYIKVTRDIRSNVRFLSITEKDGHTCDTIATGFGTEQGSTRVYAEMTTSLKQQYTMMLRQFDPSGLPGRFESIKGRVMVLTITPKNSRKSYNYPMTKISDRTEYNCISKK